MTISQRIFQLLKEKHYTQKEFSANTGISESTISDWKKKGTNPAADKLSVIADSLDVSVEYLLTGEEKNSSVEKLDPFEQKLITYYRKLDPRSQGVLLGRAETMAESQQTDTDNTTKNTSNITTSLVYSRSTDNMPPRTVIGDFSDILNAPDATDEY